MVDELYIYIQTHLRRFAVHESYIYIYTDTPLRRFVVHGGGVTAKIKVSAVVTKFTDHLHKQKKWRREI